MPGPLPAWAGAPICIRAQECKQVRRRRCGRCHGEGTETVPAPGNRNDSARWARMNRRRRTADHGVELPGKAVTGPRDPNLPQGIACGEDKKVFALGHGHPPDPDPCLPLVHAFHTERDRHKPAGEFASGHPVGPQHAVLIRVTHAPVLTLGRRWAFCVSSRTSRVEDLSVEGMPCFREVSPGWSIEFAFDANGPQLPGVGREGPVGLQPLECCERDPHRFGLLLLRLEGDGCHEQGEKDERAEGNGPCVDTGRSGAAASRTGPCCQARPGPCPAHWGTERGVGKGHGKDILLG
jgi:hypothetical protein